MQVPLINLRTYFPKRVTDCDTSCLPATTTEVQDATEAGNEATEIGIETDTQGVGEATVTLVGGARVDLLVPGEVTVNVIDEITVMTGMVELETESGTGIGGTGIGIGTGIENGTEKERETEETETETEIGNEEIKARIGNETDSEDATVIALQIVRPGTLENQTLLRQEVNNRPKPRVNLDPDAPDEPEDGDIMEDVQDDDSAMMAMMGMSGFGTTKGKQVEGNQEGGVNIKKMRTWRQYMNRRGGFNRPLDKIK
ncbi:hypothetical protein V5O48_001761 [Marasmius crinis-equi]|uniref:U4/U6.U5 small nuclear ribonucleoprotein 27kDa protein domain-containing protein n=1 Tax=Marasmius crinis-equi TaxID=585013 RepID=A0ABR3FXR0_9AGAR